MKVVNVLGNIISRSRYSRFEVSQGLCVSIDTINSWCSNRVQIPVKKAYEIKQLLGLRSIEDIYKEA